MKKKKILLIVLPILLILIIAGVFGVLYLTTDMFKSNDTLFAKYFVNNEELLKISQNENIENQNIFKKSNTYSSNGELIVLIDDGTNIQEINAATATRYDMNTDRLYTEMNLKNGEADLLKVSFINSEDVYAVKCDDILGNYIGVRNSNLKAFARNMGLSETEIASIPDNIDLEAISKLAEITEEQKQHLIDTYSKVIIESIPKEKFSKAKDTVVTMEGTNYKTNAYILSLDENTVIQMLINCLTKLKEDNTTLSILNDKLSILGVEGTTNVTTIIDEAITSLQNSEMTNDEIIKITVYEYKGKTLKTDIAILEKGQEMFKLSVAIVNNNNVQTANIILESKSNSYSGDIYNPADVESNTVVSVSQMTLKKTTTDTSTINETIIIPDTNNMAQYISMNNNVGKIQDNSINNSSEITISSSSDGINVETINASYIQNVQAMEQVEEIMELKNSNTIILNNYTIEQLTPFMTNIGNKISQVIPAKIAQLGVGMQNDTAVNNGNGVSNITNTTNTTMRGLQAIGAAGMCVGNVNGVDTGYIAGIGTVGMGIYIYNMAVYSMEMNDLLDESMGAQQEAIKQEEGLNANLMAYYDEVLNDTQNN